MTTAAERVTAALIATVMMAGCAGARSKTPSTLAASGSLSTSAGTSSPPSSSLHPSSVTPEDKAAEEAEKVVRQYYPTLTACLADPPRTKPTCFEKVAVSAELIDLQNVLVIAREMGTKVVGQGRIVSLAVLDVDLSNRPSETPPTIPTVKFEMCYDVSGFDVVDSSGKSVVPASRAPRGVETVFAYNYAWPDPLGWRIGLKLLEKGRTC